MAREFAQIKLAIWADDDWRDLSAPARYLYLTLLTSPTLSHCGVADWRPTRIAALNGMDVDSVEQAGAELVARLYLVVDEESEEVLIRSYIRNDGLMKQPKMAVAMASAHAAVASRDIRGVIVHELLRLRQDHPDLSGWGPERATELLGMRSVDPSTYPLGKGSEKGSGKGNSTPFGEGSGKGSPTPAPTPAPADSSLTPADGVPSGQGAPADEPARKRAHQLPDDFEPNEANRRIAAERGLDLRGVFEQFADHHRAKGSTMKDWHAAFNTWLRRERPGPTAAQQPQSNAQGWLRLAEDIADQDNVAPFRQIGGAS